MRPASFAIWALLLATPGPVLAQAYQCTLPGERVAVPPIKRGNEVRARITGYMLAASWSPEYCRGRDRALTDPRQCSGRSGCFGMVLHGLWPQGANRSPQWCRSPTASSPADLRPMLCTTPSARLLAYEWSKHGTCLTREPERYFAKSRELWSAIRWPDLDRLSRRRPLTAGDLRRALADANPRWAASGIGVEVNRRGWLEGVRFCYRLDYRPTACRGGQLGPADGAPIAIWRGL